MLALDLVEQLRRDLRLAAIEAILGRGVERFHVAGDVGGVAHVALARTGRNGERCAEDGGGEDEPGGRPARSGFAGLHEGRL